MSKKILFMSIAIANFLSAFTSAQAAQEMKAGWIRFTEEQPMPTPVKPFPMPTKNTIQPQSVAILKSTKVSPNQQSLLYSSIVQSKGENVPLLNAVQRIVPAVWQVRLSHDVASRFKGSVSWDGNDQWTKILSKMLGDNGLKADMTESTKQITISYLDSGQPALTPKFKSNAQIAMSNILPTLKVWKIEKGETLKKAFDSWALSEKCNINNKWSVRWDTDIEYSIDYPLSFSAHNFEEATTQLFTLYQKAQSPLYVNGYRNQCLIVISDKK